MQQSDKMKNLNRTFDRMLDKVKDTEKRLSSSEEKYRSLFEHANDAILLISDNEIIDCNRKSEEIFGAGRDQIIHKSPSDLSPRYQPDGSASYEKAREYNSRTFSGEAQVFEWQHCKLNGELFDAEVCLNRLNIENQQIIMAIIRDITERKKSQVALQKAHEELEARVEQRTTALRDANQLLNREIAQRKETEEQLRYSEAKYRDLVESANSIILEFDLDGNITFINRFAQEFFGYEEKEILGRNILGTIVPEIDSSGYDLNTMMSDLVKHPDRYCNSENENMLRSGERVWVAWTNRGIYDEQGNLVNILSIGIDRTEKKKTAEMLARQERENIAAEERNRLARDLHDAVSQTLFSASIIAEVLPRLWEKDPDAGRESLKMVRELTRGALAEMRTLLFELRPSALVDADLGDLLRQLADSVTSRARVSVSTQIEGQCPLDSETKIGFYRIAQEALNNIGKHSGANQASVSLRCQSGRVELCIRDNGKGFDLSAVAPESLGLGIMRERAAAIDAALEIRSKIDQGTEIIAIWLEK